MIPDDWIEHRRADGERVGYLQLQGEQFAPFDLLGRPLGAPVDWLDGETLLEAHGIGWLAEPWMMTTPERQLRVRIMEVTRTHVRVKADDFGAMDVPMTETWDLALPITDELRELTDTERHTLP